MPYVAVIRSFLSSNGAPWQQPRYGMLTAVDLGTRKGRLDSFARHGVRQRSIRRHIASEHSDVRAQPGRVDHHGVRTDLHQETQERAIRARDPRTGKTLWEARVPAGRQATQVTYSAASGPHLVVIAAGGNEPVKSVSEDSIVAYALSAR